MKSKLKKIISLIMSSLIVFGVISPGIKAETGNGVGQASASYSGTTTSTAWIYIDGEIGFCIDPPVDFPINNDYAYSVYNDEGIRNILYYGYPYNGTSEKDYVDTYVALNYYLGNFTSSIYPADPGVAYLLDKAYNHTAPTGTFNINLQGNTTYNTYLKMQESGLFVPSTDGTGVTYTFNIPEPFKLKVNGNVYPAGQHILGADTSFSILAPPNYTGNYDFSVTTNYHQKQALLFSPTSSNSQRLVKTRPATDPISINNLEAPFEAVVSDLRIHKTDIDTGEIITGAKFNIWNKQPVDYTDTNSDYYLGTFTTDSQGNILIKDILDLGTYYIQEIEAPAGYTKIDPETEPIGSIVIDEFGREFSYEVTNKIEETKEVYVQKDGYKQVQSNQPISYTIYNGTNASNVPLKDFTIEDIIPTEYMRLNDKLVIGAFKEDEGYQIYLKNIDGDIVEAPGTLTDDDDKLTDTNTINSTRDINTVLNNTMVYDIANTNGALKEVTVKLNPTSKGDTFTTPDINGEYNLYVKTMTEEYLLGTFTGSTTFSDSNTRSYRMEFTDEVNVSSFDSGSFTAPLREAHTYKLVVDTDERLNLVIGEDLKADVENTITLADKLNTGEQITNIRLIVDGLVYPTFRQDGKWYLYGTTKDLQPIADKYFGGDLNKLVFPNTVTISGTDINSDIKITNGDEWDTYSYSKILTISKYGSTSGTKLLPKTGQYGILLFGALMITAGLGIVIKKRKKQ